MNELYIHMAVWDEPELEFPMESSCGMNEQKRREEKRKEGRDKGKGEKERK